MTTVQEARPELKINIVSKKSNVSSLGSREKEKIQVVHKLNVSDLINCKTNRPLKAIKFYTR